MNNVFGFLVGIERYDQPGWNVDGPCKNAIAVAEWLLSIDVPPGNIYLFLEPNGDREEAIGNLVTRGVEVTRCAKFNTLDTFLRISLPGGRDPDSRLLFYWSGHGFTDNDGTRIFICSDYTAGELKNRVLNGTSFRRYLVPEREIDFFDTNAIRAASSVAAFLVFAAHYGEWDPHK